MEAEVNAKPILFSAPMVLALLAGRKTQTRRIISPQPPGVECRRLHEVVWGEAAEKLSSPKRRARAWAGFTDSRAPESIAYYGCPYGLPGDLLWVREAWRTQSKVQDRLLPAEMCGRGYEVVLYNADHDWSLDKTVGRTRAAMHMPRWASRITLRITDVRVQRLKEISSADAIAEGFSAYANSATIDCDTPDPRDDFAASWDAIHGHGAWESNPWVWALTFDVYKKNFDEL